MKTIIERAEANARIIHYCTNATYCAQAGGIGDDCQGRTQITRAWHREGDACRVAVTTHDCPRNHHYTEETR